MTPAPSSSVTWPRIAIVGAGLGGIALAVKLVRRGITSFTIYERAEGLGGTWWYNRYPGAEVDVMSLIYSYPFMPNAWTRTHARQPELLQYINRTVTRFGLDQHLRLQTAVDAATWDEEAQAWNLELSTGEVETAEVLVGATGFLNIPNNPDWPGLDRFTGPAFHTSRWEPQHDLTGKSIAVVGTGSTASQVVPELAETADRLYVFQREPGWVIPKDERDLTPAESAELARPMLYRLKRLRQFSVSERRQWRGGTVRPGRRAYEETQAMARTFIAREFADRPDLRDLVTPRYPLWGKRLIWNSTFYSALKRENVTLVPHAVASLTKDGIVGADGVERKIDALVLATGFQASNYMGTMRVTGRTGQTLQEHWNGEPSAFLGITIPGFPNFFMIYGPGTNGGEILSMLMRQAEYIVAAIRRIRRKRLGSIEVKDAWARKWHRWVQKKVALTAFPLGNNYYRGASGSIVTQWPFSPGVYGVLSKLIGRPSELHRKRRPRPAGSASTDAVTAGSQKGSQE